MRSLPRVGFVLALVGVCATSPLAGEDGTTGVLEESIADQIARLSDERFEVRDQAAEALLEIGAPALPRLVAAFEGGSARLRRELIQLLGRMGPSAEAAAPALGRALQDPEVRKGALWALTQIRGTAVPELTALLTHADPGVREFALQNLERVPPGAIPALVRMLREGDADARGFAVEALGWGGPAAVPVLARTFRRRPDLRWEAAGSLSRTGSAGVSFLQAALRSRSEDVRASAAYGLLCAAPGVRIRPLLRLLGPPHGTRPLRRETLSVDLVCWLGEGPPRSCRAEWIVPRIFAKDPRWAVLELRDSMFRGPREVRRRAAWELANLQEEACPAATALAAASRSGDPALRRLAVFALEQVVGSALECRATWRRPGPAACASSGPPCPSRPTLRSVVAALRVALRDGDSDVRALATRALDRIVPLLWRGEDVPPTGEVEPARPPERKAGLPWSF